MLFLPSAITPPQSLRLTPQTCCEIFCLDVHRTLPPVHLNSDSCRPLPGDISSVLWPVDNKDTHWWIRVICFAFQNNTHIGEHPQLYTVQNQVLQWSPGATAIQTIEQWWTFTGIQFNPWYCCSCFLTVQCSIHSVQLMKESRNRRRSSVALWHHTPFVCHY